MCKTLPATFMNIRLNMKKLSILLVLTLYFSCSYIENSEIISTHENGNKKTVHIFINHNDDLNYIVENYYPNGQMEFRGRLHNNIQEGHWTWWYENGTKKDETYFINGQYSKFRKHWRPDGTRLSFEYLTNSCTSECCDGKVIYFDSLNNVELIVNRKNGDRNGRTILYFPNGNVDQIYNYKLGLLDSIKYEYYPNGKLKVYGYYILDKEQGKWVYFDTSGNNIGYETYIDGIVVEPTRK